MRLCLEQDSRTHVVSLPREMVEQMERRAWPKARKLPPGDQRDRLVISGRRLAAELRDQKGQWIKIEAPANWFVWLCESLGDVPIALLVGHALSID